MEVFINILKIMRSQTLLLLKFYLNSILSVIKINGCSYNLYTEYKNYSKDKVVFSLGALKTYFYEFNQKFQEFLNKFLEFNKI